MNIGEPPADMEQIRKELARLINRVSLSGFVLGATEYTFEQPTQHDELTAKNVAAKQELTKYVFSLLQPTRKEIQHE